MKELQVKFYILLYSEKLAQRFLTDKQYEVIHILLHLFQIGFHYTAQAGPRTYL